MFTGTNKYYLDEAGEKFNEAGDKYIESEPYTNTTTSRAQHQSNINAPSLVEREIDYTAQKKAIAQAEKNKAMGRKKNPNPPHATPSREEYRDAPKELTVHRNRKLDFVDALTAMGNGKNLSAYLNPVYVSFFKKYAPGIHATNPMMDQVTLPVKDLREMLFAIIPTDVKQAKADHDAPYVPKGEADYLWYRQPEHLKFYVEADPSVEQLAVLMHGIEETLEKMWEKIESIVGIYDSKPGCEYPFQQS